MLNKILDVTRKITNIIVTFLYKESKSFFISFACLNCYPAFSKAEAPFFSYPP